MCVSIWSKAYKPQVPLEAKRMCQTAWKWCYIVSEKQSQVSYKPS